MSIKSMTIGIILGTIFGVMYDNIALGVAFGIIGGSVLSIIFPDKSDKEKKVSCE